MKINKVTITGADDKINHIDLLNLSIKYPFVEWSILFSTSRQGLERYPSNTWISELNNYNILLSAHFCGWFSNEVLEKSNIDLLKNLSPIFKRIQLNYNFKRSKNWNINPIIEYAKQNPERSIIFQHNNNNSDTLNELIWNSPRNIHFLYDASGGNGLYDDSIFRADPFSDYTGYAGGINSDNVDDVCKMITENTNNSNCWIDLESGIRTNNQFDLVKVESILNKTSNFIKNEYY